MHIKRYIAARRMDEVYILTRRATLIDWLGVARVAWRYWRAPLEFGRMDWPTAWAVAKCIEDVEDCHE